MFIDEVDQETRLKFGQLVSNMKNGYNLLREILFILDENGESVAERFEGSSELFDVFKMFIQGENTSAIGESIFQTDEEPVEKILSIVGISDKK